MRPRTIQAIGIDAVMIPVDHPYESSEAAAESMHTAPRSPADRVARRNAECLLKRAGGVA